MPAPWRARLVELAFDETQSVEAGEVKFAGGFVHYRQRAHLTFRAASGQSAYSARVISLSATGFLGASDAEDLLGSQGRNDRPAKVLFTSPMVRRSPRLRWISLTGENAADCGA